MDNSFVQESLTWDVEIKKNKCWKSSVSNKVVNISSGHNHKEKVGWPP
jgi:hypothetical protein